MIGNKLIIFPPNTVPDPTELLFGLAEGVQVTEPVKQELTKATAARMKKKASRTMQ